MPRTALVTGAAGFIGSHLCRFLASQGYRVRALDVRPPGSVSGLRSDQGVEYQECDIRDEERLRDALRDVATVFHLASVHLEVHADGRAFEAVNVDAVETLVRESAQAGVDRFVHTSSVGIFGHVSAPPADENARKDPQTPYERTKLRGEEAALRTAAEVDLDLVVLRPAWVFGPGCPRTAKLARTVGKGRFFYVGRGGNLRHPLFIGDLVEAYLLAATAPADRVRGRAFIIAGPRWVTLREMVNTFARVLDVAPPRLSVPAPLFRGVAAGVEAVTGLLRIEPPFSRRSMAFFQNDNAFEIGAARDALGFAPFVDLEEGLRRTFDA